MDFICVIAVCFLRKLTESFVTIDSLSLTPCPSLPGTSLYNNLCRIMAESLNAVVVSVE